nr:MauE/DoxX family redox-associated membrane protein [Allomuricauda sp.]
MRKLGLYAMVVFYLFAGMNHFLNPDFYYGLIPEFIPFPIFTNYLVGIIEIFLGVLLLFRKTRKWSAFGIIILLVLLVPSHVYFITIGSCVPNGLCIEEWISWSRLVIGQPLLVLWAWSVRNG